jgi:hypothetical protein
MMASGLCRLEGPPSAIPSPRPLPVAFVNEIVSDADIDAYELPFEKGKGHWWTRDKERDLYLWGGRGGNPLWDEEIEGRFYLFISGVSLNLAISLGKWSKNWHEKPYVIAWDRLLRLDPIDLGGLDQEYVISVLKEALIAYGRDGWENFNVPDRVVSFGF